MLSPSEIKSPCVGICHMDGGLCAGCLRTVEEIRAWKKADEAEKLSILARIEKRKATKWRAGKR